jgi:anti-sigma regulatory factor (Ser/Thr protein kinase)
VRIVSVRRRYPCRSASVPLMRADVVELLALWGRQDLAVDAELCVCELAANAVRHRPDGASAEEPIVLTLEGGQRLRLAVQDAWPGMPRERRSGLDEEDGRGLQLVAAVAADWGVERMPPGKAVWCEL